MIYYNNPEITNNEQFSNQCDNKLEIISNKNKNIDDKVLNTILKKFQDVGELNNNKKNILFKCYENVFNQEKVQVVPAQNKDNEPKMSELPNDFLKFMKTGECNVQCKSFMIGECDIVFSSG